MFIYVVKSGDSLFSISLKYQVSQESIRMVNGLQTFQLVPGQDLIIPSNIYIVQPNDSLYSIAKASFISSRTIKLYNNITSNSLQVGMQLYLPPRPTYTVEALSYITPSTPNKNQFLVQNSADLHTYFGIFNYQIRDDGSLSSLDDQPIVQLAKHYRVAPLAVITNLTSTEFSKTLTQKMLNSPIIKDKLIENIYNLLKQKGYVGVNIDFERVGEEERDLYSGFLYSLKKRLKPEGYITSVAIPAKTNDTTPWLLGYDYGGIGAAVDFAFIMAYDWHEASSPPGPVAPIKEIEKTIQYSLNYMKRNQIVLGFARYGYNWTMSGDKVLHAVGISISKAVNLAMKYQVPIKFSTEYQQSFFSYRDEKGQKHIVWFEDIRGKAKKLELVEKYKLRGGGAWQLGLEFPQSHLLAKKFFTIKKRI
ncbi:glycosyl hydrolase family 18 protein [Priestia flexa]|uniref:glycosyl hydrolase family 18 protein n=1 Tax=Priestia flexa TaxID=86664 RepID=UPI001B31BFF1|nr:glycosyl hydrolase family 18 protein [Priestia flexa]